MKVRNAVVVLPALAIALCLTVVAQTPVPAPQHAVERPTLFVRAAFDWQMQQHFPLDANRNSIPDLPNTPEYVHNLRAGRVCENGCRDVVPQFDVFFDASSTMVSALGGASVASTEYEWSIDGPVVLSWRSDQPQFVASLAEGVYTVNLKVHVRASDGSVVVGSHKVDRIRIKDILIVSIGDSYSSGEGAPERGRGAAGVARWADDGEFDLNSAGKKEHRRAHRSTLAWPAQAAMRLEAANPKTSVTFVSFAVTGAKICNGVLHVDGQDRSSTRAPASAACGHPPMNPPGAEEEDLDGVRIL